MCNRKQCKMVNIEKELLERIRKLGNNTIIWNEADIKKLNGIDNSLCGRKNLTETINSIEYKYLEITKWNMRTDNRMPIVIGFNPATADVNEIDGTNKKIIKLLKEKQYNGYYLLNLYAQVSPTKADFQEGDEIDTAYLNMVIEFLRSNIICQSNIDIIIFWGRSASIGEEMVKAIDNLLNHKIFIYKTIKKDDQEKKHNHPARITPQLVKVEKNDFQKSWYLN